MTTVYQTGAISVGSGSTSVTGSGTAWTTSGARPGDLLIAGGAVALIASVNSATSITLANSWPIETQSSVSYFILQLDDGLRALAAANLLLQALNGGALTSLAGLSGVADKLAFYNGNNTFGLTDFGAAARAFLAAGPVLTTSNRDGNAGRLIKVNDFGLGTALSLTDSDNLDALTASGLYYNPTGGNTPGNNYPVNSAGALINIRRSSSNWVQVFITYPASSGTSDVRCYVRSFGGSGWSSWSEIAHSGRIVGTIASSAGVPVIERGSNGNGAYVRFADGTQICWASFNLGSVVANGSGTWASPHYSAPGTVSFPAIFSAVPTVAIEFQSGAALGVNNRGLVPAYYSLSTNSINTFRAMRLGGDSTAADATGTYVAVGRWS